MAAAAEVVVAVAIYFTTFPTITKATTTTATMAMAMSMMVMASFGVLLLLPFSLLLSIGKHVDLREKFRTQTFKTKKTRCCSLSLSQTQKGAHHKQLDKLSNKKQQSNTTTGKRQENQNEKPFKLKENPSKKKNYLVFRLF